MLASLSLSVSVYLSVCLSLSVSLFLYSTWRLLKEFCFGLRVYARESLRVFEWLGSVFSEIKVLSLLRSQNYYQRFPVLCVGRSEYSCMPASPAAKNYAFLIFAFPAQPQVAFL